jgi:hypothetical protein
VIFLKVKKRRVGNFTFVDVSGSVCPLDSAVRCDFVGSCDVILGLDSPCVRLLNC